MTSGAMVRYGVDDFVGDMQALLAGTPDQRTLFDKGSVYLERLITTPGAIPEHYQQPVGTGKRANHGSYVLYRGEGLFVTTVVWGAGDHTGPHDHQTWGMIGVIGNGIQEERYRRVDDGSQAGIAQLVKERSYLIRPGEVSLLIPEEDEIHGLDNFSDRPTVEVHVYGKDLVGLPRNRFDVATGKVSTFASGKFDNC